MRNVNECTFVWENKSLTNAGQSLNPGLLLRSWCVSKLGLEYFYQGFLFCCLRRTPLGNIENSVGRMFIPTWEKSSGVSVVYCSIGVKV